MVSEVLDAACRVVAAGSRQPASAARRALVSGTQRDQIAGMEIEAVRAGANEAAVEINFVLPLLQRLGYAIADIDPKVAVTFQQGRKPKPGRKPEADFVVYAGPIHNRDTSLIVVEAKATWETLEEGRAQAESYAMNLRAPFVLLANGRELHLWQLQPALDTVRIFECAAKDIAAREGELELLLSRDSVIAYAKTLASKTILELSADFGAYEDAELRRAAPFLALERTLRTSAETRIASRTLVASYPKGAVITAASGLGKTTLAWSLHRELLCERLARGGGALPVHVPLADLPTDGSIQDHAAARIAAHKPGFGEAPLRDRLRDGGLALICDGFDEIEEPRRRAVQTELRNLCRDYPATQIFALSRGGAAPALDLPRLSLAALSDGEKWELIRAHGGSRADWHRIPTLLWDLAENPLFLMLLIEFRDQHGALPERLTDLFRAWLERVLRVSERPLSETAELEYALGVLAMESRARKLTRLEAVVALRATGVAPEMLDLLAASEAVSIDGGKLRFAHEALADYLWASQLATLEEGAALARIGAVAFERDSLLPVILMSVLDARPLQEAIWRRLSQSLLLYINVLRFRSDSRAALPAEQGADAVFLEEQMRAVEQVIDAFFPKLAEVLREELAGAPACELALHGMLEPGLRSVTYAYAQRSADGPIAIVGHPPIDPGFRGRVLGEGMASARRLGLDDVFDAVKDAIAARRLAGGPIWSNDRLLGRLRHLARQHDFWVDPAEPLTALRTRLEPHRALTLSYHRGLGSERGFVIEELISDIDVLLAASQPQLDAWLPFEMREADDRELARLLDEHFRREQLIYRELVDHSFPQLIGDLRFYSIQPVRWQAKVRRDEMSGGMQVKWLPVGSWDEVGADVMFDDESDWTGFDQHFAQVERALFRLERRVRRPWVWIGSTMLPDFSGEGLIKPMHGETSALQSACDLLRKDLDSIVEALGPPGR
jgi:hypothetical protein